MGDELAELGGERLSKIWSPGGGEGTVGQAVIRSFKRDHTGTSGDHHGSFERCFDGFGARPTKDDPPGRRPL